MTVKPTSRGRTLFGRPHAYHPRLAATPQPITSTPRTPTAWSGKSACVLSIGTFDGVHLGHQALVQHAAAIAARSGAASGTRPRVVVLAFDPNPLEVLAPGQAPARLTTWAQRERHLLAAGADEVVKLEPTRELLAMPAAAFVEHLVRDYHPTAIVEGADFRFGAKRAGDINTLRELGKAHGFTVDVVDQVEVPLTDHTIAPARSTMLRWLIEHGRVGDAACLLGRPYAMAGTVVSGDRRGRTIGFPTANLDSPCLAPADGVYAGRAKLPDGRTLAAAISVGTKPTFGTHARAVEAYLMDDSAGAIASGRTGEWAKIEGLPEYAWELELEFLAFVRDQAKFESLDALLAQMSRDCTRCREIATSATQPSRTAACTNTLLRPEPVSQKDTE